MKRILIDSLRLINRACKRKFSIPSSFAWHWRVLAFKSDDAVYDILCRDVNSVRSFGLVRVERELCYVADSLTFPKIVFFAKSVPYCLCHCCRWLKGVRTFLKSKRILILWHNLVVICGNNTIIISLWKDNQWRILVVKQRLVCEYGCSSDNLSESRLCCRCVNWWLLYRSVRVGCCYGRNISLVLLMVLIDSNRITRKRKRHLIFQAHGRLCDRTGLNVVIMVGHCSCVLCRSISGWTKLSQLLRL